MKRKAIIIKESSDGRRSIAVDEDNAEELLKFFRQDKRYKKKFKHICELILGNHVNRELYDKEEPDGKSKGVRAMKFFKGQENARVYCKEVSPKDKTTVTTVCVDKHNRREEDDVFEFAWTLLIQRFENTIRHKNFPGPANPDDRGMIFPDNTDGEKLQRLLRKLRHFNPVPNTASLYHGGYRNMNIRYIIEDPVMKDSQNSFFNQIVDVIAYSARQMYEPNKYMKKKGGHNFYKRLMPVLNTAASTKHKLGIVEQ